MLATIAANDMKLMSEAEVSNILEKTVFTKAERTYTISIHFNKRFVYAFSNWMIKNREFCENCNFSLSKGTTSNTANTLIDSNHKSE